MSRFDDGGDEEAFPNQGALWWANTERMLDGKRGQAFLKELEGALLALPNKRLIQGAVCRKGDVCANGALALKKRMENGEKLEDALKWLEDNQPDDFETYAEETAFFMEKHFGILERLAIAAAYQNDEGRYNATPEERYETVLQWVRDNLKAQSSES